MRAKCCALSGRSASTVIPEIVAPRRQCGNTTTTFDQRHGLAPPTNDQETKHAAGLDRVTPLTPVPIPGPLCRRTKRCEQTNPAHLSHVVEADWHEHPRDL